jgi:hypothetical protein
LLLVAVRHGKLTAQCFEGCYLQIALAAILAPTAIDQREAFGNRMRLVDMAAKDSAQSR